MRALILQHADTEGPGHLAAALERAAIEITMVRPYRGEPVPATAAGYDALVVLGGPQTSWDDERFPYMAAEAALLASSARSGRPTLGVCLGAQLLARGLGARVYRGKAPEIGLYPIALTDAGRGDALLGPLDGATVVHWHADTFDLPAGAVHLATSERYANQAFSVGRRAWGVQFHPELDPTIRAAWLVEGAAELAHVSQSAMLAPALDELHRAFAEAFVATLDEP